MKHSEIGKMRSKITLLFFADKLVAIIAAKINSRDIISILDEENDYLTKRFSQSLNY